MIMQGQLSRATRWPSKIRKCETESTVIVYAADEPYAIGTRHHNKCWLKYVRSYQKMSEDDKLPRMHNVNLREAQTIFFDHIRTVIFDEHELRSLQSLLKDCSSIISRYGFPTSGFKSFLIKDILTREFEGKIGFHSHPQRNQSVLVYDTSGVVHMSKQCAPQFVSTVSNWCAT